MSLICPFLGFMKSVIKRSTKKCFFLIPLLFVFLTNTQYSSIIPQHNGNRFVCGTVFECEMEKISEGRSYSQNNITISDCFFIRSSEYYYDGGVIYVSASSCSMNVNYSMFYNCACSGDGGAIFFSSSNSYLRMICANSCSASYEEHFSYLGASQYNFVDFLSISSCSEQERGNQGIFMFNGNQKLCNTNCTNNKAYGDSGICFYYPASCSCSFCTIARNRVMDAVCVGFQASNGVMLFSNIIGNNSPSRYGVVHVSSGSSQKIHYCIFASNQNTLFDTYSNSLEVSHSFISHNERFSSRVAVSTSNNNSLTNTITYQLQFFNSIHCNADIPLIQRSLEETLRETLKETHRETVGRTYDSECEMRMLSSDLVKRKSDMYMYPIFISFVIV